MKCQVLLLLAILTEISLGRCESDLEVDSQTTIIEGNVAINQKRSSESPLADINRYLCGFVTASTAEIADNVCIAAKHAKAIKMNHESRSFQTTCCVRVAAKTHRY